MKTYEIKISGSGTKNQIETRLLEVAREIQMQGNTDTIPVEKICFEDDILIAEFGEI